MQKLVRCACALLVASFAFAHAAFAQEEEGEEEGSEFVRTGFYLGVGGTAAFPNQWNSDFDNDLNDEASDLANAHAQEALDQIVANNKIVPLSVTVGGADLEDALLGVNGVIGYRAGPLAAFEVEGEWLFGSNESNLDVTAVKGTQSMDEPPEVETSTGVATAKVEKLWALTANVKAYPPFELFGGRLQPFAKVGLGAQNSKLVTGVISSGLTTTNTDVQNPIVVPADFRISSTHTKLTGALRVGGGIEIYATRNIVAELNASYVVPFGKVGSVRADYGAVQWRLVYRF